MPKSLPKGLIDYQPSEKDVLVGSIYRAKKEAELPAGFGPGELAWGGLGNFERGDCFEAAQAHDLRARLGRARAGARGAQGLIRSQRRLSQR